MAPPDPHQPFTLYLPHSGQGIWRADLTSAIATLARLRGEREQAEASTPKDYRHPNRISAGTSVRHTDTGRRGTITLTERDRYAVVVQWRDNDELSYVAPALLSPQSPSQQPSAAHHPTGSCAAHNINREQWHTPGSLE